MRPSAKMAQARCPVSVHPLEVHRDDVGSISPVIPPGDTVAAGPCAPTPVPLSMPPAHVGVLFDHVSADAWSILARIPNEEAQMQAWLDAHDETTRTLLLCLAQAVQATLPTHVASMEETLEEAMRDLSVSQEDEVRPASPPTLSALDILGGVVALAHQHTTSDHADMAEKDTPCFTPFQEGPNPLESPIPTEDDTSLSFSLRSRVMELAPIVPTEARPPPMLPRQTLPWDETEAPAYVDRYGFLYGMSVTEYWKRVHGSTSPTLPEASIADDGGMTVAPLLTPSAATLDMPTKSTEPMTATETTTTTAIALPSTEESQLWPTIPRLVRHVHDVYEQQQKERLPPWELFLSDMAEQQDLLDEPETIWHKTFAALRSADMKPLRTDVQRLQDLCQRGIPMAHRPAMWAECTRARDWAEPGRYQDLLRQPKFNRQIDVDVYRTMPTNLFFGGQGPGVAKLRRLLTAYAQYHEENGYCQGMNNLAAILLLTYTDEEDAFWALVGLMNTILPPGYYASNMVIPRADQHVLLKLIHSGMPKLAAHMHALGVELPAVTLSWFLSLFTACLPTETLFRVWDMLLLEGQVVLFRVAYAILALKVKALLATKNAASFYHQLRLAAAHLFDADELLHMCASLREKIRTPDVALRREKYIKAGTQDSSAS